MAGIIQSIGQFFGGAQNVQWAPWVRQSYMQQPASNASTDAAVERAQAEAGGRGSTILTGAGGLGAAALQKKQTLGA